MKKNFNAGDTWCWLGNLNTYDENKVDSFQDEIVRFTKVLVMKSKKL